MFGQLVRQMAVEIYIMAVEIYMSIDKNNHRECDTFVKRLSDVGNKDQFYE